MKLWLDDQWDTELERKPPEGWIPVKTAQEAIDILKTGLVDEASFDHDLGDEKTGCGNGYQVASWVERAAHDGMIPKFIWHIHTKNRVGRGNMQAALENADYFWSQHA